MVLGKGLQGPRRKGKDESRWKERDQENVFGSVALGREGTTRQDHV